MQGRDIQRQRVTRDDSQRPKHHPYRPYRGSHCLPRPGRFGLVTSYLLTPPLLGGLTNTPVLAATGLAVVLPAQAGSLLPVHVADPDRPPEPRRTTAKSTAVTGRGRIRSPDRRGRDPGSSTLGMRAYTGRPRRLHGVAIPGRATGKPPSAPAITTAVNNASGRW